MTELGDFVKVIFKRHLEISHDTDILLTPFHHFKYGGTINCVMLGDYLIREFF